MDEVHDYVPSVTQHTSLLLPDGSVWEDDNQFFHRILMGGDQLTVARARGSISIREDHDSNVQRLDGIIPVVEDWHAKQCLLKVQLYKFF